MESFHEGHQTKSAIYDSDLILIEVLFIFNLSFYQALSRGCHSQTHYHSQTT